MTQIPLSGLKRAAERPEPVVGPVSRLWTSLATRERKLVGLAGVMIGLALLWWGALAPALANLRHASAQIPLLELDLRNMQAMKMQAQALAAQPRLNPEEARRLLVTSVSQVLGSAAQIQFTTDRATVVLTGVAPDTLAQWLVHTRANARMVPLEVRLTRAPGPLVAGSSSWDGRVVMLLPAAP